MKRILAALLVAGLTAHAADKKITDLTLLPAASFATGDVVPIVDVSAAETKKTRILDFDARYPINPMTTNGDMIFQAAGIPARLAIGSANTVQVSTGSAPSWATLVDANVSASAGITRSKLASGTASHVLINDGSGVMSSEAALAISRGGTNNGSLAVTAGGVVYTDGSKQMNTGAGTSGQVLTSQGASAPTWTNASVTTTGPTYQVFTTGSGTYTTPANVKWIKIKAVGSGGGSSGSGTSAGDGGAGGAGGNTTFDTLTAGGGGGGPSYTGQAYAAGGTCTNADVSITGGRGSTRVGNSNPPVYGQVGGVNPMGGSSGGGENNGGGAAAGIDGTGSGAGTPGPTSTVRSGSSGAAGAYCEKIISNPSASYSYAIGAAGAAGAIGTSGNAGAVGGKGIIIVEEHYNY